MATIAICGFTAEQTAALAGVQVGDVLLIRERHDDEDEDYDEDDEQEGSDEEDEDEESNEGEDGEDEDDVESDPESEVGDHSDDESDEQNHSDDTSATEIPVPPRVYVVSAITKDSTSGDITDLDVVHLQYSSIFGTPHTYQVYGKQVSHDHSAACSQQGRDCQTLQITDLVNHQDIRIDAKPTGDLVRRVDQDIWTDNPHTRCIAGCVSGFLPHDHNLQTMIASYIPPSSITGSLMPMSYQPPICPVCVGPDLLKGQQNLQVNLMLKGMVDIGDVVEFLSRVNPRRRELGYPFEQFDEREWGFGEFDDMLSDDDEGEDGGRWEQWDEAMDPNSAVQNRPASTATIASLPRKAFGEIDHSADSEKNSNCKVCLDKFENDAVLVELPCGHIYYHEDCIEQWLKQFNNCPTCRREVPAVKETAALAEEDQAALDSAGDVVAAEMDGDDAVMSDA